LEKDLLTALQAEPVANKKKVLFRTYQSIALSKEAQDHLYNIWKNERPPQGVRLTEEDYTTLVLALAVRYYPDSTLLTKQLRRIKNPDRQKRLTFLLPALSSSEAERDRFFESLKQEENREKEAWVSTALSYLHHPLRAGSSKKYLRASLDLLEEIQLTGDIFFPMAWLQATFGSYQSAEAALVVKRFLDEHPKYNPKLKGKILQAADGIFRAEALLKESYTLSN
jgi:aminopeptidase N